MQRGRGEAMRKARKWKAWAITHHTPTDLFDGKGAAEYFKKAWRKP